jgi:hypothetical protein
MSSKKSKILVACLFASIFVACGDRERVNCPRVKNKALRAATTVTADTAGVGSARQALEEKCL